jgi:hypothetical protein
VGSILNSSGLSTYMIWMGGCNGRHKEGVGVGGWGGGGGGRHTQSKQHTVILMKVCGAALLALPTPCFSRHNISHAQLPAAMRACSAAVLLLTLLAALLRSARAVSSWATSPRLTVWVQRWATLAPA